jgi:3-oxoacyl-[acyl-carrier-protein] synthase-3
MAGLIMRGCGIAVPDKIVTNDDLSATLDTSDAWITERTGIRERRIGGTTSGLAIEAGQRVLENAGLKPEDIDILLLATSTPDAMVPATAATVQNGLGLKGGAFDLNAACSGFVYGLVVANGLISAGSGRVMLIGCDTLSRITDWDGRTMAVIVGDGAGATILEPVDGPGNLLSTDLGADGSLRHLLKCDHGGFLWMDGKEIFRRAVRVVVESAERVLADANMTPADVDLLVPHQANLRIIQAACQRLGIPMEKTAVTIDRYGNTSAASIPLALADALETGRVAQGHRLLFTGFGAGMTWASAIVRWGS